MDPAAYRRAESPQPIGGVLDHAFRLFKASFLQAVGLAFVGSLAMSAWRLFDDSMAVLASATLGDIGDIGDIGANPADFLLILPLMLGGAALSVYLHMGVTARMAAVSFGRPIGVGEALRRALVRLPGVALCLLIYFVFMVVSLALVFGFAAFSPVLGVLGGLVWVSAALALGLYLSLGVCLAVSANLGGIAALRRCFRIVQGNFWRSVVVVTVAYFLVMVAAMLAGAIALAIGGFAGLANIDPDVLVFAVEASGGALTGPILIAALLALLRDLELRREGADLAERIKATR